jgi:hypothetical protein
MKKQYLRQAVTHGNNEKENVGAGFAYKSVMNAETSRNG